MISKKFCNLCIKSVSGNINTDEDKLLKKWLALSIEKQNIYNEIKNTWEKTGELKIQEISDSENEWNKLLNKILIYEEEKSNKQSFGKIKYFFDYSKKTRPQPALIVLAFILIGIISFFIFVDIEEKVNGNKIIMTKNNEKQTIELPDGSIVHLNMASTIEIPSDFNKKERKMKLDGEAFLEVEKNSKPFVITTGNAKVIVLGTKFNIRYRNNKTKVIVKEGRVNLKQKEITTGGIELQNGYFSIVVGHNKPAQPVAVDAEYMIGWLNNKLVFEQTKLSEIVEELELLYNTDIILTERQLNELTLTGAFDYSNIDSTLEKLCLALGLKYKYKNKNYMIIQGE